MNNIPAISVIVPVYNSEAFLCECLNSVLSQTLHNIEIICVDDGSTDNSHDILQSYSEKDERIIVIYQNNCGSAIARNKALSIANGEYIAFMDSDDMYPSITVLEQMYITAKKNTASVCGGGMSNIRNGKIITSKELGPNFYFSREQFVDYKDLQTDYGYTRYIYLKSIILDNNIYFPDLLRFQDPPFFVQVMICAKRLYAITIDTYLYRKEHKKIAWNYRKVNDLVKGLTIELECCRNNHLSKLHDTILMRFNEEYYGIIKKSIIAGNPEITRLLFNATLLNNDGSSKILLFEEFLDRKFDIVCRNQSARVYQEETIRLKKEINDIHASFSFRLGRLLTFIPRKIRGVFRCYQEHGFRYTWLEILRVFARRHNNQCAK